jgi:phospholipid/cholesterol/gamma-HCH transport system substrate-binding protein
MKTIKSNKPPLLFYTLVISAVVLLFSTWFFFHPNSPWHSRNYYYIAFEEIGSLRINNDVNINGITKGYVAGFELADSCVWAKVAVLSDVKIPVNSKMHIANSGLMGERVIEIKLGDSNVYHGDGAYIMGYFDMGTTSIGNILVDIVKEANYIVDAVKDVGDTIFSEKNMERYSEIGHKLKQFEKNVSRVIGSVESSLAVSFDSLSVAKDKIEGILDSIAPSFDRMGESFDLLEKNFASLEKSLESFKNNITAIIEKLETGENTISLVLDKSQKGNIKHEMQKIAEDAETLMEKIKTRGLDLNVDIF